jgi:septum site-determining protein MinC
MNLSPALSGRGTRKRGFSEVAVTSVAHARPPLRFRGRSFIAFALVPEPPIAEWLAGLDNWARDSAGFFVGRPVVLDLSAVALSQHAIAHLVQELAARDIAVLGIEGVEPSQLGPGLPPLLKGGRPANADESEPASPRRPALAEVPRPEPTSLLLEAPVRSGQSVVFPGGDVTVIGSIASGAEVIASGSIHVYGAIRGRALAGANGNPRARIFCSKADPEMLAIDGYYRTAETIDASLRGRPIQAWLEGNVIRIAALDERQLGG